jgi:hypothetical protein
MWLAPDGVLADCTGISYFDHFVVREGNTTVVLYEGPGVIAKIDLDCVVRQSSRIRLLKNYVCDGDDILIDDTRCRIMVVMSPTKE